MENARLLQAIITTALDGIITVDSSGMIERINPAGLKIFGYQNDELVGQNVSILMPEPDRSAHHQYMQHYRKTGEKKSIGKIREVIGQRKDGTQFPLRLAVSEVQYLDRMIYTAFLHDLTREKETEEILKKYTGELEELVEERTKSLQQMLTELQQAKEELHQSLEKEKELSHLKSRLVSMASHELRTPLSAMQLSIALIEKYLERSERVPVVKYLHQLKNAIGNLNAILNEFLSAEKLEIGITTPVNRLFDVLKFAEELRDEMQLISKTNQVITYRHTGSERQINLDQYLIRHCLTNLITNAVKYSGENTVIEFSTEITDQQYLFTVKDNGIGIPEKDHALIFEPFFRAHNTGNISGTGLGLSIVDSYVNLMNGEIHFTSSLNQGTQFTLSFCKTKDETKDTLQTPSINTDFTY
ncbi:PAS domain-containing sensor histidine kinase [Chryseobacterium gotjawalense]|uniref:histidine kinase n=1 Tax=Chryseobacterium gotjawalense TaxID=3042315 RepID=A0ABY8RH28_9FLAO|nr:MULTISPECIES: PAS domain-containing sensor histidine kinase [unclassified Chryseobacterium]MDQ0477261.1 two-component system sensor kinase FixL [Chryseobacterium sp. MDT2-18]WHF52493.1 PAS domain-containing sensor histidine kinase [Chryseobacterium sp. wdc7]